MKKLFLLSLIVTIIFGVGKVFAGEEKEYAPRGVLLAEDNGIFWVKNVVYFMLNPQTKKWERSKPSDKKELDFFSYKDNNNKYKKIKNSTDHDMADALTRQKFYEKWNFKSKDMVKDLYNNELSVNQQDKISFVPKGILMVDDKGFLLVEDVIYFMLNPQTKKWERSKPSDKKELDDFSYKDNNNKYKKIKNSINHNMADALIRKKFYEEWNFKDEETGKDNFTKFPYSDVLNDNHEDK